MILENNASVSILSNRIQFKDKVEGSISEFIDSKENEPIREIVRHALFPGRRLRPVLLYKLSVLNGIEEEKYLDLLALAVELCHRSSIIVDDLVDGDIMRRQKLAHHKICGEDQSIILSHYLISAVYQQLILLPHSLQNRIFPLFTETYKKMSVAELADINAVSPQTNYMNLFKEIILYKTSALFELVFCLAAILRNLDDQQIRLMTQVGEKTGQLYQIYNDIYDDLMSSDEERGIKNTWKMNLSMGTCFILDNGSDEEKHTILQFVGKECSIEEYQKAKKILRSPKYIERLANYGEMFYAELLEIIPQIKDESVRQTILQFSKWLKQKKCWDQKELTKAGY